MKLIIIKFTLLLFLNCAISLALSSSDSTILYLKNNQSLTFEITEIHHWGIRDSMNRPVNFRSIDSIKTSDLNIVLDIKSAYKSINIKSVSRYYLMDFYQYKSQEQQFKEINRYLKKVNLEDRFYLSSGKIIGQILFGTACGFIGAMPFLVGPDVGLNSLFPAIIGYIVGSATGVYLLSNEKEIRGSYFSTLKGSAIGAIFFIFPAPIGATIGFNSSREYFPLPLNSDGLIKYEMNEVNVNFPEINTRVSIFTNDIVVSLNLLQIKL